MRNQKEQKEEKNCNSNFLRLQVYLPFLKRKKKLGSFPPPRFTYKQEEITSLSSMPFFNFTRQQCWFAPTRRDRQGTVRMLVVNPRQSGYDCIENTRLSDILVANSADLLNVGGALGDGLE